MNNEDIILLSTTTSGSRLYHTTMDTSDKDFISVFIYKPEVNLSGNKPRSFRDGQIVYYELSKFVELLIKGELTCHEVLWTISEDWKLYNGQFQLLRELKRSFISKSVLRNWLYTSSYLFGRAKRIGDIHLEDKNIINFLTSISYSSSMGTKSEPFQDAINRGSIDPTSMHFNTPLNLDHFGIFTLTKQADLYSVWQDYKASVKEQEVSGVIKDDKLVIDDHLAPSVTAWNSRFAFRGMLYYNRRKHEAYKRLQKEIVDAKVIKGYAPKSMYHSFRMLFSLYTYLNTGDLPTESPNLKFLMDIRRGHLSFDYLNKRYQEEYSVIAKQLEQYNTPEEVNYSSLAGPISRLRKNIEEKSSRALVPANA